MTVNMEINLKHSLLRLVSLKLLVIPIVFRHRVCDAVPEAARWNGPRTRFPSPHCQSAVLLRMDMLTRIYEAFACLEAGGPQRTIAMYKAWVQRLSQNEYADRE